jgi:hypothetical protein
MGELTSPPSDCSVCERNNVALEKALAAGYGIDESANVHKQAETPLDIAMEIQQALKPLTYKVLAFNGDICEFTVRLRKMGVYSDRSKG